MFHKLHIQRRVGHPRTRGAGFDLVVIDTPGRDAAVTSDMAIVSDFVVIPCQGTMEDARAQRTTVDMVKQLGKAAALIITRTYHSDTRQADAREGKGTIIGQPVHRVCPVPGEGELQCDDADEERIDQTNLSVGIKKPKGGIKVAQRFGSGNDVLQDARIGIHRFTDAASFPERLDRTGRAQHLV